MKIVSPNRTLWSTCAGQPPEYSTWAGPMEADVAIVGAGLLGLSTALHLAEDGARVTVLEAKSPGHGASGRNSGFVVPSFVTPLGPDGVCSLLGADTGARLCRLVGDSANLVFELIRRHGIRCDAQRTGWLQPAHSEPRVGFLEQRQKEWARQGKSMELLGRNETVRLTGIPSYHGALLDRTGGQLNPLGFTLGLARAALRAGATICVDSPARELRRVGRRWEIHFGGGRLCADSVLIATNSLDTTLVPRVARSLIPLVVYQLATERLDDSNGQRILPENHCATDTRRDIFAYRWTPDGRLLTGGIGLPGAGFSRQVYRSLLGRLRFLVPITGSCEIAFEWNGAIAITGDLLPKVYDVEDGLYAAIGCCGRGLALSVALGRELAAFLGTRHPLALSVPMSEPSPLPAHWAVRHLPGLLLPISRLRDRIETGRAADFR